MREIKFRAWDKVNRKWADHNQLLNEIKVNASVLSPSFLTIYDERFDVMQYTGLQDKTGRDIFDGDIVNVYGSIISGPNHNKKIIFTDVCKWKDDECKYIFKIRERDFGCEHSWGNDYEIIGNIYENPELLDK